VKWRRNREWGARKVVVVHLNKTVYCTLSKGSVERRKEDKKSKDRKGTRDHVGRAGKPLREVLSIGGSQPHRDLSTV